VQALLAERDYCWNVVCEKVAERNYCWNVFCEKMAERDYCWNVVCVKRQNVITVGMLFV
jgi:hypothetical protein